MTYEEAKNKYGDVQGVIKGTYANIYLSDVFKFDGDPYFSLEKRYVDWFAENSIDDIKKRSGEYVLQSEVLYDTAKQNADGEFIRKFGVSVVTSVSYDDKKTNRLGYVPVLLQSVAMAVIDYVLRMELKHKDLDKIVGAINITTPSTKKDFGSELTLLRTAYYTAPSDVMDTIKDDSDRGDHSTNPYKKADDRRRLLLEALTDMYYNGEPVYVNPNAFEWYPMFDTESLQKEIDDAQSEVDSIRKTMIVTGLTSLI